MHSRPQAVNTQVDTWIVVIGGFLQTRYSGGLIRIWQWLQQTFAAPNCAITSHPWKDDWNGLAEVMRESGARRIYIVGYSWGVGAGAMRLARELKALGMDVERVVSCDGVAHPRWLKCRVILNWFLPAPRISVPANVHRVDFIRQVSNSPRGHLFRTENGTELHDHGTLGPGFTHQDADNSATFFALVKGVFCAEFPAKGRACDI